MSRHCRVLGALGTFGVLAALVFAVYGRALDAPFVFDDVPAIVENPSLRRLWPLVGDADARGPLNPPPLAPTARRPLANLSLAVDHRLFGLDPAGYRATSFLLHALIAAVLAGLVRRTLLLPYFGGAWTAGAGSFGFAAAVLWALHPLASETVVYATQRTELLAALFYLLTLYAALRHWTAESAAAARAWCGVAIAAAIAGMASKEVVASVPLAVWLYGRVFRPGAQGAARLDDARAAERRDDTARRAAHLHAVRGSGLLYAGFVLAWIVLLALNLGGAPGLSDAHNRIAPPVWWMTQAKVAFLYLKLALWPWPLAIHYAPAYLRSLGDAWPWLVAAAALALAVAAAVRRRPAALFVVVVMVLVLAPTFVVPLPKMMAAERRMYLPLAGLVTLALAGGWRALLRLGGARVAASVAAVAVTGLAFVYGVVTTRRLAAYESALVLWTDNVRVQPADPMAHYNLGVALVDAGRPADAGAHFEEALRLDPGYTLALDNLGLVLQTLGRPAEARARFEEALALDPEDAVAHNNLGALLLEAGDARAALPHLEAALRHEPELPKATVHRNLGRALLRVGRTDAALAELDQAVRLAPDDADALFDRGVALVALERAPDAIPSFEAALRARPDDRRIETTLATALLQAGRLAEAVTILERVVARAPDDVAARNNLGTALRTLGRTPEAMTEFEGVLVRDPANGTAHYNLGSALLDGGRPADAAGHFEVVLRSAPDDAQARFRLAIAYVQSGRRAEGVAAAERALAVARARGETALADDVERWLAGYRSPATGGGNTRSGSGKAGPPPRSR